MPWQRLPWRASASSNSTGSSCPPPLLLSVQPSQGLHRLKQVWFQPQAALTPLMQMLAQHMEQSARHLHRLTQALFLPRAARLPLMQMLAQHIEQSAQHLSRLSS